MEGYRTISAKDYEEIVEWLGYMQHGDESDRYEGIRRIHYALGVKGGDTNCGICDGFADHRCCSCQRPLCWMHINLDDSYLCKDGEACLKFQRGSQCRY